MPLQAGCAGCAGDADALKKPAPAAPSATAGAESYEPLRGTLLRRPKSYSALAVADTSGSLGEHADDHCCPTCLEEFTAENPQIVLQCEHYFHLACIYEWVRGSGLLVVASHHSQHGWTAARCCLCRRRASLLLTSSKLPAGGTVGRVPSLRDADGLR